MSDQFELRRQERMRGAGTHAIDPRNVDFPSPQSTTMANSTMSSVPNTPAAAAERLPHDGAGPSTVGLPSLQQRQQERMRGAGSHAIDQRQVVFPSPAASTPSNSLIQDTPDVAERRMKAPTKPSTRTSLIPDLERRRLERMRGAGTHAIDRRTVAFPSPNSTINSSMVEQSFQQPPSSDRMNGTPTQPARAIPTLDERRAQRIRGAGTHVIQPHLVGFPDPSISYALTDESGQQDTTVTGFDPSMIDPRLLEQESGFEYDGMDGGVPSFAADEEEDLGTPQPESERQAEPVQAQTERGKDRRDKTKEKQMKRKRRSTARAPEVGSESAVLGEAERWANEISRSLDEEDDEGEDEEAYVRAFLRGSSDRKKNAKADFPFPPWFVPKSNLTAIQRAEAAREVEQAGVFLARRARSAKEQMHVADQSANKLNDADVLFNLIRRQFQQAAKENEAVEGQLEFLDAVLDRLLIVFRRLSQQSARRSKLIGQIRKASDSKKLLRQRAFEKRSKVVRLLQAVQTVRQQLQRKTEQAQHDRQMADFLRTVRRYAARWN